METGKKKIERKNGDEVNIYFIGDIHEGNVTFDEQALRKAVEIVRKDKNAYWIGMGDYCEGITHSRDPRFDPFAIAKKYKIADLKDLPYKQLFNVYQMLKPIDEKCLALLIGNHEQNYIKYNNSDIYKRFAGLFKSKPIRLGYVGFFTLLIKIRKTRTLPVKIALNHGEGGGGYREGYPTNLIHDLFKYINADVNVMGHIHRLIEDERQVVSVTNRGNLNRKKMFWGCSGCFLRTYKVGSTNYFESRSGRSGESDIGMLKFNIKIYSTHWSGKLEKIRI